MGRRVFGQAVSARDIEDLPPDAGPTDFVRLCGAVIGAALGERVGRFTLPDITERIAVPDGGIDAQYTAPGDVSWRETHGLIGPGNTVFQFKYRDARRSGRTRLAREIARRLCEEFPRVAPHCDRYVLLTNLDLSSDHRRTLTKALVDSTPASSGRILVIWGAADLALAVNQNPHLRHLFFAKGDLCTLDFAESELKASYEHVGWSKFVGRDQELAAIRAFVGDDTARLLDVFGPRDSGKTRLVIEALKPGAAAVVWAASPDAVTRNLFRELDAGEDRVILVVDRCTEESAGRVSDLALERRKLKTIVVAQGRPSRVGAGPTRVLVLGAMPDEDAERLVTMVAPGLPFLQRSWVMQAAGGMPGLTLHLADLVARGEIDCRGREFRQRLESLVAERYLACVPPDRRRALGVLSLLPILGVKGEPAVELDAASRALGTTDDAVRSELPALKEAGLIRERGRFVEVIPPLVGRYLAAEILARPEKLLGELQVVLQPDAFDRLLHRFRDVDTPEVKGAITRLLSLDGWWPGLSALAQHARHLRVLAPAAPGPALECLERILSPLSADELRRTVAGDIRRAVVSTLEALALRSDTFEGASRLLLALAEAENETWGNNATGVFCELFPWTHPEVGAPLPARAAVLREGASSAIPDRRAVVARACREAFNEHATVSLHQARGPEFPDRPGRPATWEEVREYALDVLAVLDTLSRDADAEVLDAAQTAVIDGFRTLARYSLLPDGMHELGERAFDALRAVANATPNARLQARIVSQLELFLEELSEKPHPIGGVADATGRTKQLLTALTSGTLTARLWHWVGPSSHGVEVKRLEGDPEALTALKALAGELVASPETFRERVQWLVGEGAEHRGSLFHLLGEVDRGGILFQTLLDAAGGTHWPSAFGAYCVGWSRDAGSDIDRTLDRLLDSPALYRGVLVATAWLPPTEAAVERLVRLAADSAMPRVELAHEIALNVQWDQLTAPQVERLLRAVDDRTSKVRAALLLVFLARDSRGAELTPSLRALAWTFLESTSPGEGRAGGRSWDTLAAKLGREEPSRLLDLVERVLRDSALLGDVLEHDLALSWKTVVRDDRPGSLRMLLRLGMVADASWWIAWQLSTMIDPLRDREVLLEWAHEAGVSGASLVASSLDASREGFWDLARELIVRWGDDTGLGDQLLDRLHTGSWSAVPMIERRLRGARALLKDRDARVARWAQQAVARLEEWRRREERGDEEEWIWDYRMPRADLEAMLEKKDSPERLWAIGRLLEDAPHGRVLELLTPAEILEALPKLDNLDQRTRDKWNAYARHWTRRH
jgi:hypothetical protein